METSLSVERSGPELFLFFEGRESLLLFEFATKNKNNNTAHATYQEALAYVKQQVGVFGPDDVILVDDDLNEIGQYTSDKKRGYRVDADHVNWWVTRQDHTEGGHARWTSREVVPNAEAGNGQHELYRGNLIDTGRR